MSDMGWSVRDLALAYRRGVTDPRRMTEEVFEAISSHPDRAIFIHLLNDRAIQEAAEATLRFRAGSPLGPLDGIPVAWKDMYAIEGIPTTAGSAILKTSTVASADSEMVDLLTAAGVVNIGRTNMTEFAFSVLGLNPHFGTPLNAADPNLARVPGGSSSGSAVAVAAGLLPVAFGSDTSGSIRVPAALNGIVGFKASQGRYPDGGTFPLAKSLRALGPLCRTATDALLLDEVLLSGDGPRYSGQLSTVEIIVPTKDVTENLDPDVEGAFEEAVRRISNAGISVKRMDFPHLRTAWQLNSEHGPLVAAEAFELLRETLMSPDADRMDPTVRARLSQGGKIPRSSYDALLRARVTLIRESRELLRDAVALFPTVPHVAPPLGPLLADASSFAELNSRTLRNAMLANFLDWCSITIPCGVGRDGMPVGAMLSASSGHDRKLLEVAARIEEFLRPPAR